MVLTPVHRPKSDIAQCRSVRSQMVDEMRQTAYAFSYVTFGSLLSQIRLCVVCLSVCRLSVTLVHPTQGLKLSAIFLHRCVP